MAYRCIETHGEPFLWSDDVDNAWMCVHVSVCGSAQDVSSLALTPISHAEICQAEFLDVFFQCLTLCPRVWFRDERLYAGEVLAGCGAVVDIRAVFNDQGYSLRTARCDLRSQGCSLVSAQDGLRYACALHHQLCG